MSRPALFILSHAPPDDPLDCVGGAAAFMAPRYSAVHKVGPSQTMSVRSMRRVFEPGVDRLLYDFTPSGAEGWMLDLLGFAPGAVLVSGRSPVAAAGVLADLRSAQRYAEDGFRFAPAATIGALDTDTDANTDAGGAAARALRRPAAAIAGTPRAADLALAVAPGGMETAYAALLGLADIAASLLIIAATRRDANDLIDIADALQMDRTSVRYVRTRRDIAQAAASAGGLIDASGRGQSDAAFIARCVGAPVLSLSAPDGASDQAVQFAASRPDHDKAAAETFHRSRPAADFANGLAALIEAGFQRARQSTEAA